MNTKRARKIIMGINKLLAGHPRCGLSFSGVDYNMGPLWCLDGITPVGVSVALRVLKDYGANTASIDLLFAQQEEEKERKYRRKERLIESARKKLTPAEISACGI